MHSDSNWSFNAEVGVLFQGKPRISSLTLTGLARNARPQLEALKTDALRGINKSYVRFWPLVSIGFKYKF